VERFIIGQREASSMKEVSRMKSWLQNAIIGSSNYSSEIMNIAEQTCGLIASHKAVLICGGKEGVMEALHVVQRLRGGLTVGILLGPLKKKQILY
jgi:hypothetical protein